MEEILQQRKVFNDLKRIESEGDTGHRRVMEKIKLFSVWLKKEG
jgi:hypothetical protein